MSILALSTTEDDDLYARASCSSASSLDCLFYKAVCCIPFLGAIPALIIEIALRDQIEQTTDRFKLIELAKLSNQYKTCGIAMCVFSGILTIVTVVLPIIYFVAAYLYAKDQAHNQRVIRQLQSPLYNGEPVRVR